MAQIKVKSLITGKERTVGPNFLEKQVKPVVGPDGKGYHQGEYVLVGSQAAAAGKAPKSPATKKIIADAKAPAEAPAPEEL